MTDFGALPENMSDYLQKYLPEFDEAEMRQKLAVFGVEDLTEMLIRAYKERRVFLKMLSEAASKVERIKAIAEEPSRLSQMPDVPGPDDLRKMMEE